MEENHNIQSDTRRKIAFFVTTLGVLILLSGFIINPWVGKCYRNNIVNYHDVMLSYFIWSSTIGFLIICNAAIFYKINSKIIDNITILFLTISLILISDRLLLAKYGLPLWVADSETHYKHRPNAIRKWGENKLIRINKYGHHDDEFPLEKRDKEFRGLIIGDSITMGHGVQYEETFANQLEDMLKKNVRDFTTYQIINTGVQGYSTFQEYHVLMRSLIFKPDFIAIGFCMNDVSEPFVVNKEFGGVGLDYHGVTQVSNMFVSYIFNETGYGRLMKKYQNRGKRIERRRKWESYNVKDMAQKSVDNPNFSEPWKIVLSYMQKSYDVAKDKKIKFVLLIFPHTFQLMNDNLKEPQRILVNHAKQAGIDLIDFTAVFEKLIFENNIIVETLVRNGFSYDEINGLYKNRMRKYFLDSDHYTPEGHKIVASHLYTYLLNHFDFESY